MPRSDIPHLKLTKCLVSMLLLSVFSSGAFAAKKAPEVDLSILEQRDSLGVYLTSEQKLKLLRAEELIEEGQSDIRSGEHLAQAKSSAFATADDIKKAQARGQSLVEAGNDKVLKGQMEVAALLEQAKLQRASYVKKAETKYDYSLTTLPYSEAIQSAAEAVLGECWKAGYNRVLFDRAFTTSMEGTVPGSEEMTTLAYESFVKADSTRFSLKFPKNLSVDYEASAGGMPAIKFDEPNLSGGEKAVLIAIEEVETSIPEIGTLLVVQAIDVRTQAVISHHLYSLSGGTDALKVHISDTQETLVKLSSLRQAYWFNVSYEAEEDAEVDLLATRLLQHSIVKNTGLKVRGSEFLIRAYTAENPASEDWLGNANAKLAISSREATNEYDIRAVARESGRVIPIGSLTIN